MVVIFRSAIGRLAIVCTIAIICQIALGGWTSANYAALVCADFPTCQGHWWPPMDWNNAFSNAGAALENNARVTIQMAHRIGALFSSMLIIFLGYMLLRSGAKLLHSLGIILLLLLALQISLGISNVLGGLPLMVSLAHSATAVLLLLCLITILFNIYVDRKPA